MATSNNAFNLPLSDGQLIVGKTGLAPVATTLTAGPGISITNAPGSIQVSNTTPGFTWNLIGNAAPPAIVPLKDNGYICVDNSSVRNFVVPPFVFYNMGDSFRLVRQGGGNLGFTFNVSAGGYTLWYNGASGTLLTSTGAAGSAAAVNILVTNATPLSGTIVVLSANGSFSLA